MTTEIQFSTRYVLECSWRGPGYIASVVNGPQDLVFGGTPEYAIERCKAYFAENYEVAPEGEACIGCGVYRPKQKGCAV